VDPDRLTWAATGLVWLVAAGVLRRSRPTAVLGLLVSVTWFAVPVADAGALWHRGPLIHLLLAAGSWWPRSRVAQVVVIGGYAVSASPDGWPRVEVAVIGVGAVVLASVRERSARPHSPARRGPWQAAIALTALALLLPPVLAWAGLDARWSAAVLIAYSVALSLVALLVVAALRPWTAPWATDLVVDLGQEPASSLWEELVPERGDQDLVRAETEEAVRASRVLRARLAERQADLTRALIDTRESWERLADSDAVARMRLAGQITALTGERLTHVVSELEEVTMSAIGPAAVSAHRAGLHLVRAREQLDSLEQGLVGAVLSDGLGPALSRLVAAATVPVDLDADEESLADLPVDTATTAYFAAAETLTNAVKHAGAQRIAICAQRLDGHLELTVVDDGRGGAAAEDGGGLSGVCERALEAGGTFDITSPARRGTEVRVVLPVGGAGEP
jgi:signal transduction histidine kinase